MDAFYDTPQFSTIAKAWLTKIEPHVIINSKHKLEAETHLVGLLINKLKLANNYYLKHINQLKINNPDLLNDNAYMTELLDEACYSIDDSVNRYLRSDKVAVGFNGWTLNEMLIEVDEEDELHNERSWNHVEPIMMALHDTIKQIMTKIYK